jgi:hypothetical protein
MKVDRLTVGDLPPLELATVTWERQASSPEKTTPVDPQPAVHVQWRGALCDTTLSGHTTIDASGDLRIRAGLSLVDTEASALARCLAAFGHAPADWGMAGQLRGHIQIHSQGQSWHALRQNGRSEFDLILRQGTLSRTAQATHPLKALFSQRDDLFLPTSPLPIQRLTLRGESDGQQIRFHSVALRTPAFSADGRAHLIFAGQKPRLDTQLRLYVQGRPLPDSWQARFEFAEASTAALRHAGTHP